MRFVQSVHTSSRDAVPISRYICGCQPLLSFLSSCPSTAPCAVSPVASQRHLSVVHMHLESVRQFGYRRSRSAAPSCEPSADLADQLSQSDISPKDCSSQPGSSVSALSDMLISSPAEVQLESDLQCEERHHFLSSPQDSNTSALSYHDPSFISPMPIPASRCPITPPQLPSPRLQDSQPSPSEVPTEALWDTESVACHGELHRCTGHSSCSVITLAYCAWSAALQCLSYAIHATSHALLHDRLAAHA